MKLGASIIAAMLVLPLLVIGTIAADRIQNTRGAQSADDSKIPSATSGVNDARANAAESRAISLWSNAEGEADKETKCPSGSPFYGCCSSHKGIREVTAANSVMCNDNTEGTFESTCTKNLRGCCSGRKGVAHVADDGRIMCSNGELSPQCACERLK
jgi:hypothetical protein